jgi:hypothetical protein
VTAVDLNRDGSTRDETTTVTSGDGLTKTVQYEATGDSTVNSTETDDISVAVDGTRTETVENYAGSGTSSSNLVSQVITVTSATGDSKTVTSDLDGNGTTDLTTTTGIAHNEDGSITVTLSDINGDGSLRDKTVATLSADGNRLADLGKIGAGLGGHRLGGRSIRIDHGHVGDIAIRRGRGIVLPITTLPSPSASVRTVLVSPSALEMVTVFDSRTDPSGE